jgi:histidinol-phosphatase
MIAEQRPLDGVVGEEFDDVNPKALRQWVLDPIDGTRNYVRGVPVWAILIALMDQGQPTVGVVHAPALGRSWWAATGHGAYTRDIDGSQRRLAVSGVTQLAEASLSFSDPVGWPQGAFDALWPRVDRVRGYGDFWSHMMVAEGVVDIAAEPQLNQWDQAALVPIVREAGGMMTGLDGSDLFAAGSSLTTNGHLHEQVLALIRQR